MHRKFIINLIKFIAIFIAIDFLAGSFTQWMFFKQETGKFAHLSYIMDHTNKDIVIFGSSHARDHYDPVIFEKNTGLSCYNAGVLGQAIFYISVLQEILIKRIHPKIIILNIDRDWLYSSQVRYDRLCELNPYLSRHPDEIERVLRLKSPFEKYKLWSRTYRFNSTWAHIIRYLIAPQPDISGFRPIYVKKRESVSKIDLDGNKAENISRSLDTNFEKAFHLFISRCQKNDIVLITVMSPEEHSIDLKGNQSMEKMVDILKCEDIPFLNHLHDSAFVGKINLFHDNSHLNVKGADIFSESISNEVKEILSKKSFNKQFYASKNHP